jgi:hypothetical protein
MKSCNRIFILTLIGIAMVGGLCLASTQEKLAVKVKIGDRQES